MEKALKKPKTYFCKEVSLQTKPEKEVASTCAAPVKASLQSIPLHCICLATRVSTGE